MLHLDLDFTDKCDLGCFYCDRIPDRFSQASKRKLTTEDRISLILQAKALGAKTVEFPGAGEPMQDSGFWQVIETVSANGMVPVLFTAGHRLDDRAIDRLFDLGASVFLKFSTIPAELNDKFVQMPGYTVHARSMLDKMIERGFNRPVPTRLAIDMIVTKRHRFEEVGDVHRWCRRNNIHSYISYLIPEGRADKDGRRDECERSDRLLDFVAAIDREEFGLDYEPVRPMVGGYRCRQVNIGLFVNLYGQVYDCNGLGRPFFNVFERSLEEIWNSKLAKAVRRREQEGFCAVRERVWRGTKNKGVDRKTEEYDADQLAAVAGTLNG